MLMVRASPADGLLPVVPLFVVLVQSLFVVGFGRGGLGRFAALVEKREPALDAVEVANHLPFERDEDLGGVVVRPAADLLRIRLSLADDLAALLLGRPGQLAFLDEVRSLLLRSGEDLLGFLTSLVEQSLALRVDSFGVLDLLGDRDTELIDVIECLRLVDDDAADQRQTASVGQDRLESFDEEDDVDETGPPSADGEAAGLGRL